MMGILQTSKLNTSCVPNNCGYKISVDKDVMVQPGSASARGPHMLHGWSRLTYAPWLDHEKGKPWWIFQRHGSCGVYFAQKIHVLAPRRKIHGWEILYIDGRNVYIGKTPSALGSSNDESLTSLKRCFFFVRRGKSWILCAPWREKRIHKRTWLFVFYSQHLLKPK